jgi:hypothetical protein
VMTTADAPRLEHDLIGTRATKRRARITPWHLMSRTSP